MRLVRYIAKENPVAARQIGRELLIAGDSLLSFPFRGRRGLDPTTRELVTIRPYVIVYEADDAGNVQILNVWHAAQNRPEIGDANTASVQNACESGISIPPSLL